MTSTKKQVMTMAPFDQEATAVLARLRAALAAAIANIPGTIRRATDLQRATQLDTKLSWRLFKMAQATDPVIAGPHIPGPANIRTFLAAAERVGVRPELLSAVEAASRNFEELVRTHAGDRGTFDTMISSLANNEQTGQVNFNQRRAAYRANRHLWGVEAEHQIRCVLFDVGDEPSLLNIARIEGYLGLKQLRRSAPLIVAYTSVKDDAGSPVTVTRKPIDSALEADHEMALLPEFCSEPLPRLQILESGRGFVRGELISHGIGNGGAIDCFSGWHVSNVPCRYSTANNEWSHINAAVYMPCESITVCVMVRNGLFDAASPTMSLFSDHLAGLPYPSEVYPMKDLLLPSENLAYMGRGVAALATPELPLLMDLAEYSFKHLGWASEEFDVYHVRIAYPIMPTTVNIRFKLLEKPAD